MLEDGLNSNGRFMKSSKFQLAKIKLNDCYNKEEMSVLQIEIISIRPQLAGFHLADISIPAAIYCFDLRQKEKYLAFVDNLQMIIPQEIYQKFEEVKSQCVSPLSDKQYRIWGQVNFLHLQLVDSVLIAKNRAFILWNFSPVDKEEMDSRFLD